MKSPSSDELKRPTGKARKWLIRSSICCAVLFALLFVLLVVHVANNAWYWQETIGRPLERELGFRHGSPYIRENESSLREVLTIEAVSPGGIFDDAGFKTGDIVRGYSINGLFRALHEGRGKTVIIRVVHGGDGLPLHQRDERIISVPVPP